jgi:hypothetical protein
MTTALRLTLTTFFFALVLASPAAARHRRSPAPPRDESAECLRRATPEGAHPPDFGQAAKFDAVRFSGAPSFSEDELWDLVGGSPSIPFSKDEAVALLARLVQSGVFSSVEPRVRQNQDLTELELALTENPRVQAVRLHGLSEFRTEDVLSQLLDAPEAREVERRSRELREAGPRQCPAPLPPRAWLARVDGGEVRGGILWQGLRPALERVLRDLRNRGYSLARLQGELTPAGDLIVDLDEGRLGRIEVRGVDPHLVRDVEDELGVRRGDVFSSGELHSALERIEHRWPFLRPDYGSHAPPPAPALQLEQRDGGMTFRSELPPGPQRAPRDDDDDFDEDEPHHRWFHRQASHSGWYGFEGDTLVVYLRSKRSSTQIQWTELFRHTPVTGFAPGLAGTLTLYDPGDRTHLLLDGAVNFNTRRHNLDLDGSFLEKLNGQQRVDWLAGTRLRLPALGIAELGGQIHNLTDTADRWRISSIDSYLYSALINRADREYYRRSGYTAFITAHFFEELTLGAEYRRDRYAFLAAPPGVWTVFNRDDPRYGSAPVTEGEMGSMVFRLEYRSEKVPLHKVGSMWRAPETSLVESAPSWSIGLRTIDTVEVADKSLGGMFDFTKFVSDNVVTLETGRDDTLTLRLRGAGGHDLPLQKQEALGGWTALRGYDFKEFRGDASLLGTLQLQGRHFGAFLDVGSVRQVGGSWIDPKASAGALFCFDRTTCAEAAWRLDSRAKALPDFRILFAVPL